MYLIYRTFRIVISYEYKFRAKRELFRAETFCTKISTRDPFTSTFYAPATYVRTEDKNLLRRYIYLSIFDNLCQRSFSHVILKVLQACKYPSRLPPTLRTKLPSDRHWPTVTVAPRLRSSIRHWLLTLKRGESVSSKIPDKFPMREETEFYETLENRSSKNDKLIKVEKASWKRNSPPATLKN